MMAREVASAWRLLASSRSDTRRFGRSAGGCAPMTPSAVLLGDPVRPARAAGVRWRLLGGQPAQRAVQFAAAVQAAMEDGCRVFAELSRTRCLPAPSNRRASLDMSVAALAGMRRGAASAAWSARLATTSCAAGARWTIRRCIPLGAGGCAAAGVGPPAYSSTMMGRTANFEVPSPCIRCLARMCG